VTDIAFYHLVHWPLETALPRLLEKTLEAGKRAVVMVGSEERVEALVNVLWTYEQGSWLPHGSAKDGNAAGQPVWLTAADENPNGASYLFLVDGAQSDRMAECERCFELFDGNDADAVAAARRHWKAYADTGHDLTYWRQSARGGWERQDAAAKE
jgi:DNA polymerase-3 subunit chi